MSVLLVPALLWAPLAAEPADAADPATCQGYVATIVADGSEPHVEGTDGPDVIVVDHPARVSAGAGDDVVCMKGGQVDGGDGDDRIESALTSPARTDVVLGPGDDRYRGGSGRDVVYGGLGQTGKERVVTGAGPDSVSVDGDADGPDRVDLGAGRDTANVFIADEARTTVVRGGPGRDTVGYGPGARSAADWQVDLALGTVRRDGEPVSLLSGVEEHSARLGVNDTLKLWGTSSSDDVRASAGAVDVRTRGGSDTVIVGNALDGYASSGFVDLGAGRHDLLGGIGRRHVTVDLDRGRARLGSSGALRLRGAEDAFGAAKTVRLVGSAGANRLLGHGCSVAVQARAGDDVVRLTRKFHQGVPLPCVVRRVVATGGRGRDLIAGSEGPDRLVGGSGRDVAYGGKGTDRCEAEREISCER